MNILKYSISLALLIVISIAFASCDSDDDTHAFSGTVRYLENQSPAVGIPVELQLFDEVPSFNLDGTSNIVSFTTLSDGDGRYSFNINANDLPNNPHFLIMTKTDTLLNVSVGGVRPGTVGDGCTLFYRIPIRLNSYHTERDLFVDHPTFLQITFDKLNHESTDSIRFRKDCVLTIETSLAQPDTTILETRAYNAVKNTHTRTFNLLTGNGLDSLCTLEGIQWKKRDTTKITVEY